ncbi:beta-ketoacyl-[acyl-carrier-protein] synthase family protein [Streptomyces sp. LX-29]|uniref:beta-ketoacyl-[acyl-carrier-protein] synthase family protein n=1 Tax=Streptomyces sp. LX-29 TaxID=2900152 RepID=UPI00240D6CF3|nr:beta-ketoacyl-[acyl-carrier-protein] synthase family protein [Streptomyces sp. LX-29]WFB10678.1 beta-ketoacyl-[acyl-carrier-protein] synthase family protein [Streptomyces sp. LX-29]
MSGPAGIAVTGLGLVTPGGIGTAATWDTLLTGRSTARRDPLLSGLPVDISCRVADFDPLRQLDPRLGRRLDRFTAMALVAAREAVADADLDPASWPASRVAVVIGVGTASMEQYEAEFHKLAAGLPTKISPIAISRSVPNMAAGEVGMDLDARGPNLAVSTACASGATALGVARDLLRTGSCDIVVAGGSESGCTRVPAACFHQMQALSRRVDDPQGASRPFDADRDGFVLAEGAGMLVLERLADAAARRAPVRARLTGYGASCDAFHFAAPHPDGDGAVAALRTALADAGWHPSDVDHVNAHGTGTRLNDSAEARALHRVFDRPPPVTALKGALGHSLGATGAIEAACTVLTLQHQLIPPTANLDRVDPDLDLDVVAKAPRPARLKTAISESFGFGGQNAVLAFAVP